MFEKDLQRGISNYTKGHKSDTKFLKDLDDYFYEDLKGYKENMPKLFDWVNENLENYKI